MLIAALSGRALAVGARRAGYEPLVADLFADEDTQISAAMSLKTPGDLETGLDADGLVASLSRLARGRRCEGLVCGAGFEDRPQLLSRLAASWPLLGNDAATVARSKDPFAFAALCARLGVPHPPVQAAHPADPHGWLVKRIGGAGGTHVRAAAEASGRSDGAYYQRKVEGRAVSALFLADGENAMTLGLSAQWTSPTREAPARYGGAVRPAGVGRKLGEALRDAVGAMARGLGLHGLNSADFLVGEDGCWLIEINPRPGATLDLFDRAGAPLFALHVAACNGRLPAGVPRQAGAAAAAIAYATRAIDAMPRLDWPAWCADRQSAGSSVAKGEPVCTVTATARSADRARALAEARVEAVLAMAQGRQH